MSLANFLVNEFNKSKSLGDNPVTRETKLLMKKVNQKSEDEVSDNLKHTVNILNFINKTEQEIKHLDFLEALKKTREVERFMQAEKEHTTKAQEKKLMNIRNELAKVRVKH